jgi:hypothetical protein
LAILLFHHQNSVLSTFLSIIKYLLYFSFYVTVKTRIIFKTHVMSKISNPTVSVSINIFSPVTLDVIRSPTLVIMQYNLSLLFNQGFNFYNNHLYALISSVSQLYIFESLNPYKSAQISFPLLYHSSVLYCTEMLHKEIACVFNLCLHNSLWFTLALVKFTSSLHPAKSNGQYFVLIFFNFPKIFIS